MRSMTRFALVLVACTWSLAAGAQDAADDEASVLLRIAEVWAAEMQGDGKWVDEMLADDFMGWNNDWPAPRNKDSVRRWQRFSEQMGRMVNYEIHPLSVTVHGDVAVAHYLYTSANKSKVGDIEVVNGRYTDILVRTEDGWKFLAWNGGDD